MEINNRELVEIIGTYEPFIKDIYKEQGYKFRSTFRDYLSNFYRYLIEDDIDYLKNKYPMVYNFINNNDIFDLPPHKDYWEIAELYDIVMKTGTHYSSSVENGNHYVVLEVLGDNTVVILDTDGKLKHLCYPEEYKVIGKVQDMINESNEKARIVSEQVNREIEEYRSSKGLFPIEKKMIKKLLDDGETLEFIKSLYPYFNDIEQLK